MKKPARRLLEPPYRMLLNGLAAAEDKIIQQEYWSTYSPIFLIGVPRSGTTLMYQLMTSCFELCYISNFIEKYKDFPCLLSFPLKLLKGCDSPAAYENRYGETTGWRAPSQGRGFWDRWFRTGDQSYVGRDELSDSTLKKLRSTIFLMQKIYRRPFVNKALSVSVRILPISKAFPEAVFIRVHRDHLDTAQSILKGREEYGGDRTKWFSVKPSEYSELAERDCIDQVCGQIYYLEKDMDRDMAQAGTGRCLDLHYSDICFSPEATLDRIARFYNGLSPSGTLKRRSKPPDSFRFVSGKEVNDLEYEQLRKSLHNYFRKKRGRAGRDVSREKSLYSRT